MSWLRDNILKILIILGVTVIVIIVFTVLSKPKESNVVRGSKYAELETKLQSAAIKYINKHTNLLPKATDDVRKIDLKKLVDNGNIGNIVAIEDSNVSCTGYVEISKINDKENRYRYTPFLSCGKYYTTKTIGDYIINSETKEGTFTRVEDDGLYKINDEYVYRGEHVNNYIMLDSKLYRIIKIDNNKELKLISTTKTQQSYVWDDRYNIDKNRNYGINNFRKSRIHDALNELYDNNGGTNAGIFTSKEKDYIIKHEFCIGKRNTLDNNIYSGVECNETIDLNVGLITIDEYARASIDSNCNSILDKSCANYNYFSKLTENNSYTYMTLTGLDDNTYEYYKISGNVVEATNTSRGSSIYPVIYINSKTIYFSGTGTLTDPYIVR